MKSGNLSLPHFRALKAEKPASKIAFFRGLYPEIAAALRMGHTLKTVHRKLLEDGVEVSYTVLRVYFSRIRRERTESAAAWNTPSPASPVRGVLPAIPSPDMPASGPRPDPSDPMATAMQRLRSVRGFSNFTGAPPDPSEIF